ncbi:TonB-dependent receptor [Steroidobacter agaridevorans]|uniref:TonB-dependent receptor n=1 Tax=Steroidobacter agaridevorans TaxID=2695856 RepID=A0A829YGN7_9GAMM|nr:TonB-dependent receptor [Steroidobacter agaridevorans]GFE82414.1 TonB-dependent receptor [Steroidobacter agaridevorans]
MRMSVAAAVACLLTTGLSIADQANAAIRKSTNIEAQGLGPALRQFAKQRDIQIIYRSDVVGDRQTSGAVGDLTVEEALHQLLNGTGLTYLHLDDHGITIVPSAEASVPTSRRASWSPFRLAQVESSSTLPAQAPSPSQQKADPAVSELEELVVTGTLIRGAEAPIGTNVVGLTQEDIVATGAMSANDALTRIPQVTSAFLSTPNLSSNDQGVQSIRPNLRDLGRASGTTTLVIVDGHRVAGGGGLDPDVIPPGVLERVEVVPDGGSSIYGSDAIGGTINFITRKSVDGVEAIVRHGFGEEGYSATDVSLTAGNIWDTGSGYVSYAYATNDAIRGRDREFITGLPVYCAPGTILANGTTYAVSSRAPGTSTVCDQSDDISMWPEQERHNVFAAFTQELGESLSFDLRSFYMRRETTSFFSQRGDTLELNVTNQNPYFQSMAGETSHTVRTTFAGVIDNEAHMLREEFSVTPSLNWRLPADWELRLLGGYQTSNFTSRVPTVDQAALVAGLAGTTTATALNPYNLGASSPAVLGSLLRESFTGGGEERLYNGRAIAEGPVFSLPAGDVRFALGLEYVREEATSGSLGTALPGEGENLPKVMPDYSRDINSVFGEVNAPIVAPESATSWVYSLSVAVSARYDDYSDVGGTFNPKIGVTYEPVDWVKLRGNWGTSFNAPTPGQRSALQAAGALPAPLMIPQNAVWSVVLAGMAPDVQPQTADIWSIGVDILPPAVPGLTLSATYYNIYLKDMIGLLPFPVAYQPALAPYLQDNQTCATVLPRFGSLPGNPALLTVADVCALDPNATLAVLDLRQQNLGELKQDGIDFNLSYQRPVSFGAITASLAGTYTLHRENAIAAGAEFVSTLDEPGESRFFLSATLGAQVGALTGAVSLSQRQGYDLGPPVTNAPSVLDPVVRTQTSVDSFRTVDLFFNYDLPSSVAEQLSLTLNVSNVLDEEPPFFNGCQSVSLCGYTNGSTLGRVVTLGVRSKW